MIVDSALGIALVIGGLILFGVELAHPGVLLLIPGSMMIVAGVLYLLLPNFLLGTPYGVIIVVLAAIIAAMVEIPYYRYIAPNHRPMSTTSAGLAGEVGVVISPIIPNTIKGKVQFKSEVWSARADVPIPNGSRVRVLHGEGVSVTVQRVEP